MKRALSFQLRDTMIICGLNWYLLAECDMAVYDGPRYVLHPPNYLLLSDIEVTQKILCH